VQQVEIEMISAETGEARLASARHARRDLMTTTVPALKPAATCGMAVMAKASAPGRTKTRLVPPLTFDEAAALNTARLRTGDCSGLKWVSRHSRRK
jgi:hypothetical protein